MGPTGNATDPATKLDKISKIVGTPGEGTTASADPSTASDPGPTDLTPPDGGTTPSDAGSQLDAQG